MKRAMVPCVQKTAGLIVVAGEFNIASEREPANIQDKHVNLEIFIVKNISWLDKTTKIKHAKYFLQCIIVTLKF